MTFYVFFELLLTFSQTPYKTYETQTIDVSPYFHFDAINSYPVNTAAYIYGQNYSTALQA